MLTLRDYFAAAALAHLHEAEPTNVASRAFDIADAMMAESVERFKNGDEDELIRIGGAYNARSIATYRTDTRDDD